MQNVLRVIKNVSLGKIAGLRLSGIPIPWPFSPPAPFSFTTNGAHQSENNIQDTRQVNRVNSRNDLCHDDSIINIVPGVIIIIIIIIVYWNTRDYL